MRTDDERIKAMHRRAKEIEKEDRARKVQVARILSAAGALAAVVALAFFMPRISGAGIPVEDVNLKASLFAESPVLGYIVIGLLAFLLGVSFTVFCYRLLKWQEQDEDPEEKGPEDLL